MQGNPRASRRIAFDVESRRQKSLLLVPPQFDVPGQLGVLSDPEDFLRRKHVPTVRTHDSLLQTYMDGGRAVVARNTFPLGCSMVFLAEPNAVGSIAYHEEVCQPRRRFAISSFSNPARTVLTHACLGSQLPYNQRPVVVVKWGGAGLLRRCPRTVQRLAIR